MPTSVAVTGLGVLASLGNTIDRVFNRAVSGDCGISATRGTGGGSSDVYLEARVPEEYIDRVSPHDRTSLDRSVVFSINAARSAWAMADEPRVEAGELAVVLSAGLGGLTSIRETIERQVLQDTHVVRPSTVPRAMPNAVAARVAIDLGAHGGAFSPISACSSGLEAIAMASGLIRSGQATVVVAGGAEAVLDPLTVQGFAALRALSTTTDRPAEACRPFDRARNGFVMAEGAAVLVLESTEHARARQARVLAEVVGTGITSDGYHLVAPEPSGVMAAGAMSKALRAADRRPQDVSGVYAHATGTVAGDAAEAVALERVFGPNLGQVPVTGLKSMTGHLIGASGSLAAAIAVQSLRCRVLTPTPNFESTDVDADLDVVGKQARPLAASHATLMVNAFGFGGQNVSVLLSDPTG